MPDFFIPLIGQQMRLLRDWAFPLHDEDRNHKLVLALFGDGFDFGRPAGASWSDRRDDPRHAPAVVAAGTVLKIERIYIRQGLDGFNSVTFRVVDSPDPRLSAGSARFWAKLDDVNGVEVEWVEGVPMGARRVVRTSARRSAAARDPDGVHGAVRITAENLAH